MAVVTLHATTDISNLLNGTFAAPRSFGSDFYNWATNIFTTVQVTALSGLDDIAVDAQNRPTAGTITAVYQSQLGGEPIYSVLDVNSSLTALIDTSNSNSNEKFWEQILSGGTSFFNDADGAFKLSGDFINIVAGETRNGGDDAFELTSSESFVLFGDAFDVKLDGTLIGRADRFTLGSTLSIVPTVAGDADTHAGTVNGGADTIDFTGFLGDGSVFSGDVITSNGLLNGGADRMTINARGDFAADVIKFAGDAIDGVRQVNGGNDVMLLKLAQDAPMAFIMQMAGDVHSIASSDALVDGGDDTLTVWNIRPNGLAGDVFTMSAGALIAGNDSITFNGSGQTTIVGDVFNFTGGTLTPGADNIRGGSGDDVIFGESSTPNFPTTLGTTVESGGNDAIDGREGNDTILGQVGNDTIIGGRGNDILNGGSGNDTVSFATLDLPVYVDLAGINGTIGPLGLIAEAIGQGIDDIVNCENVIGSSRRDTIKGDGAANLLLGGNGDDVLNGRAGNDTLTGGQGADRMVGGAGNDTFRFLAPGDSGATTATADLIIGFSTGDRIDLSAIDADPASATAAFTLVANFTGAGQVTVRQIGGNTIVNASTDADIAPEFVIVLRGLVTLTAADFVL